MTTMTLAEQMADMTPAQQRRFLRARACCCLNGVSLGETVASGKISGPRDGAINTIAALNTTRWIGANHV
jgi:hypothetical protein